jgi:C1A family cysteine protease
MNIPFEKVFLLLLISLLYNNTNAQNYGTGALLDYEKFGSAPKSPPLTRGDFTKLPEIFSLKMYAPTPGDQGSSSTCTGWSTSYGARTILEAINNDWSFDIVNENTFSPSYVYNQIRPREGCDVGASLVDGLDLLKNDGVLPYTEFGYDCDRVVNKEDKIKASSYRVKEYREILSRTTKNKVLNIKKSLTQLNPIVIGFNCPKSFYTAKDVWHPKKEEYVQVVTGHAATIVGFDDNVEGGSFEILNSWGINWGNDGFIWIRYSDIEHFCVWAAELIAEKKKDIAQKIHAEIFLREYQRNIIDLNRNINSYETVDTFKTGTKFQLYIINKDPAYLYIFSHDPQKGIEYIYPINSLMSDYLAYSENNIILPSEDHTFELDDEFGISSLIILISTESLRREIDDLLTKTSNLISVNDIITKLSTDKRKVNFESELNKEKTVEINKTLSNNFISMMKIDIFHAGKEE